MSQTTTRFFGRVVAGVTLVWVLGLGAPTAANPTTSRPERVGAALGGVAVPFVANAGQHDRRVAFAATTFAGPVFVTTAGELVYSFGTPSSGWTLVERIQGLQTEITASDPGGERVSWLLGRDPERWRRRLPGYRQVNLGNTAEGVAVSLRATGRNVEKLFTVPPGGTAERIRVRVDGALALRVAPDGGLVATTGLGEVHFTAPVAFQEVDGLPVPVAVAYVADGASYRFELGPWDRSRALVIDPLLQTTYVGGAEAERPSRVLIEPESGDVVVAGWTQSPGFPGASGGSQSNFPGEEGQPCGFLARFSADLTRRVQATYLGGLADGGSTHTVIGDIAFDPETGGVFAAGRTEAADFPGTDSGAQPALGGEGDAFLALLTADLGDLVGATYFGGSGDEYEGVSLAIHPQRAEVYLAGSTLSADLPATSGGAQFGFGSSSETEPDGFVVRVSSNMADILQATYMGTGNVETLSAVAVDESSGMVYVAGTTDSDWLSRVNDGAQEARAGSFDVFLARFEDRLTRLDQSTFLGGIGSDQSGSLLIDPTSGSVVVSGSTASTDFPGVEGGALGTLQGGGRDAFVARLSADLTTLVQSTFYGGSGSDRGRGIVRLANGGAYLLVGETSSQNLPGAAGAAQDSYGGGSRDAFAVRLRADLGEIEQATYFGGSDYDSGAALTLSADASDVYLAGWTRSDDLPVREGGAQSRHNGTEEDAFVVRVSSDLTWQGPTCEITCSASADPADGPVPLTVAFSATVNASASCSGDPVLSWDFGDGSGSATGSSPSHIYTTVGRFVWGLDVSVDDASCSATGQVFAGPEIAYPGELAWVIPAAAHTSGAAGTQWVTDVVLHNPNDEPTAARLFLVENGQDSSSAEPVPVPVPAGASVKLPDVLSGTFGSTAGSGAIVVGSSMPLVIASRTFNTAPAGTFGQFIPALPWEELVGGDAGTTLLQLTGNQAFRTNVGLVNLEAAVQTFVVDLYRADGTLIESREQVLPQFSYTQLNSVLEAMDDAFAVVGPSPPGGRYATYASVVDNLSGDPIYVGAVPGGSNALWVPAAAHVAGAAGTNWRTDLEVHSFGSGAAAYRVEYLPAGTANTDPDSVLFSLSAGTAVRYQDVISTVFAAEGAGAIRVAVGEGSVRVTSRTFNAPGGGTYGQFIAGMPSDAAIAAGRQGRLVGLMQSPDPTSGYRTNIGVVNASAVAIGIGARLYAADGTLLGTRAYTVPAYGYMQEGNAFAYTTDEAVDNGFAVVSSSTPGAVFFAYASVVDNGSGDPVYVPAVVMEAR